MTKTASIVILSFTLAIIYSGFSSTPYASQYSQAVHDAQKKLTALGYKPGKIEGYFGHETMDAIKRYQRSKGLAANGILDEKTKFSLGIPKGLNISITDLIVENGKILSKGNPVDCGVQDNTALEFHYEYKLNWNFSDFSGDLPIYTLEIQTIGNNGAYQAITKKEIQPKIKNYEPGPGISITGTQTDSVKMDITLKGTCKTIKSGGMTTQTLTIPKKGNFEFIILVDDQRYSKAFSAW